jgi:hypothetical protein
MAQAICASSAVAKTFAGAVSTVPLSFHYCDMRLAVGQKPHLHFSAGILCEECQRQDGSNLPASVFAGFFHIMGRQELCKE